MSAKQLMNFVTALYIVMIIGLVLVAVILVQDYSPIRVVPTCPEDAVLVGTGDFDNGRWSDYECGPALDDFTGHKDSDASMQARLDACAAGWWDTMNALNYALTDGGN